MQKSIKTADTTKGITSIVNGLRIAPTPMTKVELMIIDPNVLPNARFVLFLMTDLMEIINSGNVVAVARKTEPNKYTGIVNILENCSTHQTKIWVARRSVANAMRKVNISLKMCFNLTSFFKVPSLPSFIIIEEI